MKKVMFISALFVGLVLVSCSKDEEEVEEPTPMNSCDTESMSFQNDILPIFNSNCNGCHNADANSGGVTLDNFTDVKSIVSAGRLLGAINRDDGFSPMPQNAAKLADCNIDKIDAWVSDGAPDN